MPWNFSRGQNEPLPRRAFVFWLRQVLLPGYDLTEEEVPALLGLEEFRSMLADNVRRLRKQLLEQGRAEGRQEGRAEERAQGRDQAAALLLRQLELKFGPVDESIRSQVREASSARRLTWAGRILTATSLGEVFARRARRRTA
jgi:flagellar biosynthesis/type III secretory pathway protein FliH